MGHRGNLGVAPPRDQDPRAIRPRAGDKPGDSDRPGPLAENGRWAVKRHKCPLEGLESHLKQEPRPLPSFIESGLPDLPPPMPDDRPRFLQVPFMFPAARISRFRLSSIFVAVLESFE